MPAADNSLQPEEDFSEAGSSEDDPALPALEMLELAPRLPLSVDASGQDSLLGRWAYVEDDTLLIRSSGSEFAFGLWAWQLEAGGQYPGRIEVEAEAIQSDYWLVLPDFRSGRWDFAGPFSGETVSFELDPQQHAPVNAKGEFYVLVLSQGPCRIIVHNLSVTSGPPGNYPDDLRKKWLTATTDLEEHCIVDWEGELVEGRSLYRRYAWQPQSEMKRVDDAADSGHSDSELISEAFCYYQLFDELPGGELRAASPLALGRRGPEAKGYELRGRLFAYYGRPAVGEQLKLGFANLRCSTDSEGHFSFSGLGSNTYPLEWYGANGKVELASAVIADADLALGDLNLPPQLSGPRRWSYLFPPQQFSLVEIDEDSIELSWQPVFWAMKYSIYRLRGADDWDERFAASTSESTIRLDGEPNGLNRYYVVASHSQPGWSSSKSPPSEKLSFESNCMEIYPDSIYATADRYEVLAGEEVLIRVFCKETSLPLSTITSIGVAYPRSTHYVKDSFNVGSPGGLRFGADGMWEAYGKSFLDTPEAWIYDDPISTPDGEFDLLNLTIATIYGRDPFILENASGEICNFRLEVNEDTALSFLRWQGHAYRTYFNAFISSDDHFWSHDYNDVMPVIRVVDSGEL